MNIEALAREAGAVLIPFRGHDLLKGFFETRSFQFVERDGSLEIFAALVRAHALEEAIAAAQAVKTRDLEWLLYDVAEAIRALAKPPTV